MIKLLNTKSIFKALTIKKTIIHFLKPNKIMSFIKHETMQ